MTPAPHPIDDALSHTEWVRRLASSLVSEADADDLVQDGWEAALQEPGARSRGWWAGALRNLAAFRHRTASRRARREAATHEPEATPTPDVVLERLEAQRLLTTLVAELPDELRIVLYLRYFEGLDATAIGARLELPPGTVRWRLKQGVDTLRAQLDERLGGRARWSALLLPFAHGDGGSFPLAGALLMKAKHLVALAVAALVLIAGAVFFSLTPSGDVTPVDASPAGQAAVRRAVGGANDELAPVLNSAVPAWRAQSGAPNRRVAGRVTLEGAPVAGAVVTLSIDDQPTSSPPQERTSADDGTFDFGAQPAVGVAVGAFLAGHAAVVVELDLRNPEATPAPERLELALAAGCPAKLSGRVLDSGAGPVANAVVRPMRSIGARSGADGAYELCLPIGESRLLVEAPGYGGMIMRVWLDGQMKRDVVLTPEATLDGVVVDTAGAPVADALVTASQRMFQRNDGARPGIARSDERGRFTMSVAPGEYRVSAVAGGNSTSTVQVASAVVGEATRDLRLVVRVGVRVRGIVMSRGKPVAGARITGHTVATGRAVDAFSQADGRFVLDGVPPGELVFTAEPWAVEQPRRWLAKADAPEVMLQVGKMASVSGVVTRLKKPVPGAKVVVQDSISDKTTVSDAQGRYVIEGLSKGHHGVVATSETLGAFVQKSLAVTGREPLVLDLELDGAGVVEGVLVDEQGEPVSGAMVSWQITNGDDQGTGSTDAQGRFRATQLKGGGVYAPTVYLSGKVGSEAKPASGAFPTVRVEDGNSRVEGVRLAVKVEKLQLAGRVVTAKGEPVVDARIRAEPGAGDATFSPWAVLPQVFTDARGRFVLEGLSSGSWSLQARTALGEEAVARGEAGQRDLVITVHPAAHVEGKLVGYAQTPVVYGNQGFGRFVAGQVTGDTFHLSLPAGTWVITAMDNQEGDIHRVTLRDGEKKELTMQSRGMGKVVGQVVDFETGAPMPDLLCRTMIAEGTTPGVTNWDPATLPSTDETGRFTADPAPAGHLLIGCLGDEGQSGGSVFTDLAKGATAEVLLKVVRHSGGARGRSGVELYSASAITGIEPGSAAQKAGLQAGDLFASIDGRPVTELDSAGLMMLLENHPPGSAVPVVVVRQGRQVAATLTFPP